MLCSNMDFNFAHFANFNFAHFEIEESFGLMRLEIQNDIHFGYSKGARFKYRLYLCSICVQREVWENLGKKYRMIH